MLRRRNSRSSADSSVDPPPPRVTSRLRIGTPALATRGFGDAEFTEVADIIALALQPGADLPALRARVATLANAFPLYAGLNPSGHPAEHVELASSVER